MLPKPYYDEDGITIYCGDCRDILPHLPKVDLVLTDPPYGVNLKARVTKDTVREGSYDSFDDTPEYIKSVVVPVISMMVTQARVVLTPGTRNAFLYPQPDNMGCIYFPAGAGRGKWGFSCYQPILFYGKDPYLANGLGGRPDSLMWHERAEENGHPCPKPLKLMKWFVNRCSMENETILDPFMGSGTTLLAAKDLGRKAIGIEISEEYCRIAVERLAQKNLFGLTGDSQ